jgi:hypothetical protein
LGFHSDEGACFSVEEAFGKLLELYIHSKVEVLAGDGWNIQGAFFIGADFAAHGIYYDEAVSLFTPKQGFVLTFNACPPMRLPSV